MRSYKTRFITPKFTLIIVIIGILSLIIGIALFIITTSKIGGIVLVLLGIYFTLSHTGIDIDINKEKFRPFISHFGIKEGKWKLLKDYPFLSILTINQKQTSYSLSGIPFSSKHKVYKVYLLNKNHTSKIFLEEFKNRIIAERFIKTLADDLKLEIKIYSPDFSKSHN